MQAGESDLTLKQMIGSQSQIYPHNGKEKKQHLEEVKSQKSIFSYKSNHFQSMTENQENQQRQAKFLQKIFSSSQTKPNLKQLETPQKQIKCLRQKIKQQEFLIEFQNAVHTELIGILSKKSKSLDQMKSENINNEHSLELYDKLQSYLDKGETYLKQIKKLENLFKMKKYLTLNQ